MREYEVNWMVTGFDIGPWYKVPWIILKVLWELLWDFEIRKLRDEE